MNCFESDDEISGERAVIKITNYELRIEVTRYAQTIIRGVEG